MLEFKRTGGAFNYIFEKNLAEGEIVILKMPEVSANKRNISGIGWQSDGNVKLYGTLSSQPENPNALWQEINENEVVNKTIVALKIENTDTACNIAIRTILY